jgi:translation initiation factor 1
MTTRKNQDSRTVYSTDHGKLCPTCSQPMATCACRKPTTLPKGDGIVRVGRETQGRKGKGVTVITGVPLGHDGLQQLAKQLKQKCGSGGTVKDGVIEIQGDQRDIVVEELHKQGYVVKRSGG